MISRKGKSSTGTLPPYQVAATKKEESKTTRKPKVPSHLLDRDSPPLPVLNHSVTQPERLRINTDLIMDEYSPPGTEKLIGEARSNQFNDIEAYEKRVKSFQDKADSALN